MANHALLDNVTHKDLRVITRYGAQFGDNVGSVITFPTEYGDVQREYPIFFRKDTNTGEFMSVALLGLQKDENLFLEGDRWDASYVPGVVARGPFLIGFREHKDGNDVRREAIVHIDMDSPRVSTTEGEPVFLEQGGNSPYLQSVTAVLDGLNRGAMISKAMFAALDEAKLIESVDVEIKLTESEQFNLRGFYTISNDKLRDLDAESLHKLHRSGFLQGAYLVLASLGNLRRLIDRKRRRHAQSGS